MKVSTIVLVISIVFLISCSTIPRIICPEEQYTNLKNIPIYLTAKDTVTLFNSKHTGSMKSNGPLEGILIENYKIDSNSVNAVIAKCKAKI